MQSLKVNDTDIYFEDLGDETKPVIVWAHGWGQNHQAFLPIMQSLESMGRHILVDLPGFGQSSVPLTAWGTADYADAMADLIKEKTDQRVIWVGHSFGCRVGLQIAARHPGLIKGMILIAAAGLKRKRPLHKEIYRHARIYLFKFLKNLIPLGLSEDWLRSKFGSADYKNAGAMRGVFIKTVNEDLSDCAAKVTCPVTLIYGTKDTETPPEIGERFHKLIPNSEMVRLTRQDHYTVLDSGRHQITPLIKKFIESLNAES